MPISPEQFLEKQVYDRCKNAGASNALARSETQAFLINYKKGRYPRRGGVEGLIKQHVKRAKALA